MYPPLPIQRKIAAILSAYDDLIENNTRRIKILEEMAQALYREWFVRFRFPGHENVQMVDSPMGVIPEGWEVKRIGEVIETLGGGTPSTKNSEFWVDADVIWFTPSDLTSNGALFIEDSSKKISKSGLQRSSARLFPAYSVMMTSRATIGVTAINTREACTNQGFITCIPNKQLSAYQIYYWIQENKDEIINVASGATYKEINRTEFREFLITIPDIHITGYFLELITPIMKEIENLISKNLNLNCTRDLLLPKLISGELDVDALDIKTEGMTA
jgi:type I restriction enzyme S subunit